LVLSWNLSWGVTPISLEGAWLWPLAIVLLVLSLLSFRGWRRARRANET
jgi:predicted membrane protein